MPYPSFRRLLLPLLVGVFAILFGIKQIDVLQADRSLLKPYDFVQYWSAGRLLLDGGNPYDPDQLLPLQRSMWEGVRKTIMMWNPPWTLSLTLPFAALPWRLAQFLWIGLQMAAVLFSADALWRIFGGDVRQRWVAWLAALLFAPTLFLLMMGQIAGLLLLGVTGFLYFMHRQRPAVAGCFAALAAIKPHLSTLFALVLLLEATCRAPARKAVLAGGAVLLASAIVPLLWDRHVWSQYFDAMSRPPSDDFETMREFEHPTVGYWLLRVWIPDQPFWTQFIPVIIALPLTAVYWSMRRCSMDWDRAMPWLVLFALFTAGYGAWTFDLVLILLPILQMAVWLAQSRSGAIICAASLLYLILNFLCLLTIREAGSQANPWITPLVLVVYGIASVVRYRV